MKERDSTTLIKESYDRLRQKRVAWYSIIGIAITVGLYLSSQYNYLLFHSLVEMFSVIVAVGIFIVVWHTRNLSGSSYLMLIGFAYLSVGTIEFMHALSYNGIGVFPNTTANLPTQLWIQARYVEAFSLFLAPLLVRRRINNSVLLLVYVVITTCLLGITFATDLFPVCYIEGEGITPFKKGSEYAICMVLLFAAALHYLKRKYLETGFLRLMLGSIALTIMAELAFTRYLNVYGPANLVGHFLIVASFVLIYKAVVVTGLNKPQDALAESERTLRAFIDSNQDAICIRDRDRKLILWNQAFANSIKTKCGIDVRVGMHVEDYVAEEILAKFKTQRDLLSLAFGGEPQRVEFEYPCADGKICYLDTQWTPIRNKGEVIAIAEITRDITEQKQQAEEILIYNERLENFVKRAPIIIYFIKLDNPMPLDGNLSVDRQIDYLYKHAYIEDANDFWAKTIGYNQGKDLIGLRLNDFLPRENPESIQMLTKIIRYNYSNVPIESMETYPSGVTKFYINNINSVIENNKLLGIWGTSLNITELKIAEKKLIEAESKYRTVADFTFDWEYWINPKRSFEYISPSCKRITGYSPDEFFENPKLLDDIVYEEDKDLWIQHALNDVNQQGPEQIIFRIKRKDDAIRYIEHICQPVYDKDSIFVGIRASNRDITERRLAQQESQQLRSELIHASRVAAMGELTAAIAHELSQPLTAVMSNAQAAQRFLKMEKPDLAEVRDILTDIIGDDNRAKEIIQKLRSLLKKSERKFEKINIDEIIQDVMPLLHSDSVIKNVIVKTQFEKDLPHVFGDKIQLQQVLVNLILNGFEAMIDVDSKELCITTTQKDPDNIMVSIRDSGPGVKVQYIEDLFQPFFTTKANGMGMGLSICRSIIESHGGNVWAKNNPDQGATFYFTIPVFKGT